MPKVFVSHSTQDREFVESEIIPLLESCGVEAWYARDSIVAADQWERSILQGLKACDCFLLVMSPRSARSSWVKAEVDWVFHRGGKKVVPVLLEDCDSDDFHIGLAAIQHVDFRQDRDCGRRALLRLWGIRQPEEEEPIAQQSERPANRPEATRTVHTGHNPALGRTLAGLELSVRAINCLESEGITTVRELVLWTENELLEVRNFGETTLREVKVTLAEHNLCLGMRLPTP